MSGFVLRCPASHEVLALAFFWLGGGPWVRVPSCSSKRPTSHSFVPRASVSPLRETAHVSRPQPDWPVSVPSASVLHVRGPLGVSPARSPCLGPHGPPIHRGCLPPREELAAHADLPRRHQACLPLPRGSDPVPGTQALFSCSEPAPRLRRLCCGSPVDPALDLLLRLDLLGPSNSLPSSRIPGKSWLPWSLSPLPSARTSSLPGAPTGTTPPGTAPPGTAPGASAGAACCCRRPLCLVGAYLPVTAAAPAFQCLVRIHRHIC